MHKHLKRTLSLFIIPYFGFTTILHNVVTKCTYQQFFRTKLHHKILCHHYCLSKHSTSQTNIMTKCS